jgi:hypothetical protein
MQSSMYNTQLTWVRVAKLGPLQLNFGIFYKCAAIEIYTLDTLDRCDKASEPYYVVLSEYYVCI